MAMFHMEIQPIQRSAGRQATAAAAYRSGERIRDEQTGELHNYSRRKDVLHTEIFLPAKVDASQMEWALDRATLWNAAEAAEKRSNSRVAREYQVSLPSELAPSQRLELGRKFSQELADRYGVAVDLAIHEPRAGGDPRNFHAHLLTTTREVTPAGLGAKMGIDMQYRERLKGGLPSGRAEFFALRERWAVLTNDALREANIEARVDHRTLRAQGIDREPKPFIPIGAYKMERSGVRSPVAERLREDYRARVQAREERAVERARTKQATSPVIERGICPWKVDEGARKAVEAWRRYRQEQSQRDSETGQSDAQRAVEAWRRYRQEQAQKNPQETQSRERNRGHDQQRADVGDGGNAEPADTRRRDNDYGL
jgi:ATP-dependent exoDNAse (exonuclease V) alpha subunit